MAKKFSDYKNERATRLVTLAQGLETAAYGGKTGEVDNEYRASVDELMRKAAELRGAADFIEIGENISRFSRRAFYNFSAIMSVF